MGARLGTRLGARLAGGDAGAVAGAGVLLETHGSKDIPEEFLRRGTVRPVDL